MHKDFNLTIARCPLYGIVIDLVTWYSKASHCPRHPISGSSQLRDIQTE